MAIMFRAVLLTLLLLPLISNPARAGTYDVYSCTLPDGRPAPTDGWSSDHYPTAATRVWNTCGAPPTGSPVGALGGEIFAPTGHGGHATWIFTAPRDTTISGLTVYRTFHTVSGPSWFHDFAVSYSLRGGIDPVHFAEFCTPYASCWGHGVGSSRPFDAANRSSISGLDVQQYVPELTCDVQSGGSNCSASASNHGRFDIYSARFGLSDPYRPEFGQQPRGPLLAGDSPLEGEKSVTVSARDRGSGIEWFGVVVDGVKRVQRAAVDPAVSTCRRPFTTLVPCPLASSATVPLDTATLPNGTHTIQASVTDAAGNETRSDPVTVTTLNGSEPNGRGASRFVMLSAYLRSKRDTARRSAIVPFGSVRFAEGRLVDAAGKPIAGALLEVDARVQRPGARYRPSGTVTTGQDGRFAFRIAKGPSRTVRFAYKAYTLDPAPVSTASISLGVRAGMKLSLRPHRVNNGQKVKFSGRLRGGPNRKGTRVTIDVLVPDARRRVPIGNVQADRRGRFHFVYRFRRTLIKARYRFQARLTPQPSYPYRGATSRRVAVVVSP